MDARELQKLIEDARELQKLIEDGLGGDNPTPNDSPAWAAGIRIGNALRKALR